MLGQTLSFLLVEDDELDVESFRRALHKHDVDAEIQVAGDGSEALTVLRDTLHSGDVSETLIVLDLNMPGMNGHEFLEELREDVELRHAIVFVLTSSDHDRDIRKAYDQNVAGYFVKSEVDSFIAMISSYGACVKYPAMPV